ncbi:uncharacterized protein TNCV_1047531 [Trichonephila clavipes]|nr:uncharacterized protein TNCV_1047531 [Trichonephila clavipes]
MTTLFVCGDPVVSASILLLIYRYTPLPQLVWWHGVPFLTVHGHPRIDPLHHDSQSLISCNRMCCHLCNGSQEPFFNKAMLGLAWQGCYKTVSALLQPFLGMPDLQNCLQSSIFGMASRASYKFERTRAVFLKLWVTPPWGAR